MSKLQELRKQKGLTQRQLADTAGVSLSTIRNWENQRVDFSTVKSVLLVCQALGCDPLDLTGSSDGGKG